MSKGIFSMELAGKTPFIPTSLLAPFSYLQPMQSFGISSWLFGGSMPQVHNTLTQQSPFMFYSSHLDFTFAMIMCALYDSNIVIVRIKISTIIIPTVDK